MRAVSVTGDAIVVTSLLWQTTATALRAGDEAMLIDSPYFPDELEVLPTVLAQAGFEVKALLATHGDFDHVLGRLAFPELSLGVAESTMLRLQNKPGEAQRDLRNRDNEHYVTRPRPLALGGTQTLPVPGKLELGGEELELHRAEGHTDEGMAVFAPWLGVLITGDYLSSVEIPMLGPGGTVTEYRATLARLAPLVERSETVVTGHGPPSSRDQAVRLLDEDTEYLAALERGEERPRLPDGRDDAHQRRVHSDNLAGGAGAAAR
ncbi:MAG: MBL fold metallo-hydrolase [Thermoleophilaceae bacterium]|nr:MBL fold metallo-hydrolase [Thermoleophilaceae bacterium]